MTVRNEDPGDPPGGALFGLAATAYPRQVYFVNDDTNTLNVRGSALTQGARSAAGGLRGAAAATRGDVGPGAPGPAQESRPARARNSRAARVPDAIAPWTEPVARWSPQT